MNVPVIARDSPLAFREVTLKLYLVDGLRFSKLAVADPSSELRRSTSARCGRPFPSVSSTVAAVDLGALKETVADALPFGEVGACVVAVPPDTAGLPLAIWKVTALDDSRPAESVALNVSR